MAKALPSAADAASKWQSGFSTAGAAWSAGIDSVQTAPGQLAVAALPRYLSGVQQNANKWAAKTGAVTLAQWKQAAKDKGPSRLASGATAGMPKYQAAIAKVLDAERAIIASLPPRGTVEQNIQRSSAFQLAMHQQFQQGM